MSWHWQVEPAPRRGAAAPYGVLVPTPQYVLDLRAVWGHRPLILPGVSAVVFHPDGERILLVRRADNGRWSLPAGIVEPGEQPADCIARELWEEARVRVRPERVASVIYDELVVYPNGDECRFMSLTFRCRWLSGEPAVGDEESTDVGWFALDDLPDSLVERSHRRIEAARAEHGEAWFEVDGSVSRR